MIELVCFICHQKTEFPIVVSCHGEDASWTKLSWITCKRSLQRSWNRRGTIVWGLLAQPACGKPIFQRSWPSRGQGTVAWKLWEAMNIHYTCRKLLVVSWHTDYQSEVANEGQILQVSHPSSLFNPPISDTSQQLEKENCLAKLFSHVIIVQLVSCELQQVRKLYLWVLKITNFLHLEITLNVELCYIKHQRLIMAQVIKGW